MRIFIIGFKNSGKTTAGRKLAKQLNMDFIDLDEYIETKTGRSIPDIFTAEGEEEFRNIEWESLVEISKKDDIIISTGGGAPCWCDNMNLMLKKGETIYLQLDNDTLISRLKKATADRPIVKDKDDNELREYVSHLKQNCEHHYLRAKHIVDGKNLKMNELAEYVRKNIQGNNQ